MSTLLIKSVSVIQLEKIIDNYAVLIENEKIKQIAPVNQISENQADRVIDGKGNFLSAGFIDLHCHAVHDKLVDGGPEQLVSICKILPQYSVTGFLRSLLPPSEGKDVALLNSLAFVQSEGTAIFAVSPELAGILEIIPLMRVGDTPVFITHTAADVEQTVAAIKTGARHATHFYDVFPCPEQRDSGVRPPDRTSDDLAVDVSQKGAAMLRAWRNGVKELPEKIDFPNHNPDLVREDWAFCKANDRHPNLFKAGENFYQNGLCCCSQCPGI